MIDWNDAFDNSGYVPEATRLVEDWTETAAAFRTAHPTAQLDLAYGDRPRNHIDLFFPSGTPRGVIVFVHGGYWHRLDKSVWSHFAAAATGAGWAMAIPGYTLAPEVRITNITREIAQAVTFAASRIEGPLRLAGHSAGGHLVSRMACADGPLPEEVAGKVEKIISISGVHDLRPMVGIEMNRTLRLTDSEAAAESPVLHQPNPDIPVTFWVGAKERPEFLRQTRLIAETWSLGGGNVRDVYEPDRDHFTVVAGLADPQSPLVAALLGEEASR